MPHACAQRLGDRTEDVRVAVRHALAEQHARAELLARDVGDLVREPALAHARVAVQQHELRPAARPWPSASHGAARPSRRRGRRIGARPPLAPAARRREHAHRAVRLDRFVAAADAQQPERFVLDALARRGVAC